LFLAFNEDNNIYYKDSEGKRVLLYTCIDNNTISEHVYLSSQNISSNIIYDRQPKAYLDMCPNQNNLTFTHKKKISSPNLKKILNRPKPVEQTALQGEI